MDSQQLLQVAVTAGSVLAFMVPALVKLGIKFQAVQGEIAGMRHQVNGLERGLAELKTDLAATGAARKEIWSEINNIRERTTRLSTIAQLKEEKCQTK